MNMRCADTGRLMWQSDEWYGILAHCFLLVHPWSITVHVARGHDRRRGEHVFRVEQEGESCASYSPVRKWAVLTAVTGAGQQRASRWRSSSARPCRARSTSAPPRRSRTSGSSSASSWTGTASKVIAAAAKRLYGLRLTVIADKLAARCLCRVAVQLWLRDPRVDQHVAANDRVGRRKQHARPGPDEVRSAGHLQSLSALQLVVQELIVLTLRRCWP